jgi:hypothetical protein
MGCVFRNDYTPERANGGRIDSGDAALVHHMYENRGPKQWPRSNSVAVENQF